MPTYARMPSRFSWLTTRTPRFCALLQHHGAQHFTTYCQHPHMANCTPLFPYACAHHHLPYLLHLRMTTTRALFTQRIHRYLHIHHCNGKNFLLHYQVLPARGHSVPRHSIAAWRGACVRFFVRRIRLWFFGHCRSCRALPRTRAPHDVIESYACPRTTRNF